MTFLTKYCIEYGIAETDQDLEEILELQKANHHRRPENLDSAQGGEETKKKSEGFVTARHDIHLLRAMSAKYPHVVARATSSDGSSKIIGYTLSLPRDFDSKLIPCLEDLNRVIDQATFYDDNDPTKKKKFVSDRNYIIMGQVCISKEFRGKGIFAGLYHHMKERLSTEHGGFDCIVTSISHENQRSVRAHTKIGFRIVHNYYPSSCSSSSSPSCGDASSAAADDARGGGGGAGGGGGGGEGGGGCGGGGLDPSSSSSSSSSSAWCIVMWDWSKEQEKDT